MGGSDVNNQMTRLEKIRRHYHWPRRLIINFFVWVCYNAYIIMSYYSPHTVANKRPQTFKMFLNKVCLNIIGPFHAKTKRCESRVNDDLHLQNVGIHFPERSEEATGDNTCAVCCKKYQL